MRIIQHLVFPQSCVLCGRVTLNRDLSQVCPECLEGLERIAEPLCQVCGRPLPGGRYSLADTCAACRSDPPDFDMARAWGPYQGELRELLRAYKYRNLRPLAGPMAGLLGEVFDLQFSSSFDWIVPVPLHQERLKGRGYDQALLLGRSLSKKTGIPVLRGIKRKKKTLPQYGLSSNQRKLNTAGAFAIDKRVHLEECSLLVLDDVFTTGSTVSSLCRCLRKSLPVKFIGVLTVARAIRHGPA